MLDYDGTVAPFRIDRGRALPHPDSGRRLARIGQSGGTRVAIISGRPVRNVVQLLEESGVLASPDTRLELYGEHGWERWRRDSVIEFPLPPKVAETLLDAARDVQSKPWRDRVEHKRSGLVLHTRGLPEAEALRVVHECRELWAPWAASAGLRLDRTDGGIEMRARERDKSTAVTDLMSEMPEGVLAIYIGDDLTDEDAFEAVRDEGFGLLVAEEERPTHAAGRLPGPDGVAAFLEAWYEQVERQV
jgi:trehalose-phosphatase